MIRTIPALTVFLALSSAAGADPRDPAILTAADHAGLHAARASGDGYRARNPGQRWDVVFDRRGVEVRPDGGAWRWGLDVTRFGFAGHEIAPGGRAELRADGGRVTRSWSPELDEWYVNDGRGLAHGFTVHRPPAGDAGLLAVELGVRGSLRAAVDADGLAVRFVTAGGAHALSYTGLVAFDAGGARLPARIRPAGAGLRLEVDAREARFPLTIDPVAYQAYLKSADPDFADRFADSIALSGDTIVVGVPYEDSNAVGIGGDPTDDSAKDSGAAYVFRRTGGVWVQEAYLKASNADVEDYFGISVAISGDTIVVGALGEDSGATGVNGAQDDNGSTFAGAAYVFVRSGTTWSQQAYLKASNAWPIDRFGAVVAAAGESVYVTATFEASGATGINGDQSDNSTWNAGAVYAFVRSGTTWTQQAYIKASNTGAFDGFGRTLAAWGDTLVVGASGESSAATGVNGDQLDDSAVDAGAAYVFERTGTTWSQTAYLKASNTDALDDFSRGLAVGDDIVVVGSSREDSASPGVNGDPSDNSLSNAGAAYVYVRGASGWVFDAYLKAAVPGSDGFGGALAVSGDTIAVGAGGEDSAATGVGGDQTDDSAQGAGAVYLFERAGTTWSQTTYVKASNTEAGDAFGAEVALTDDLIAVGTPIEPGGSSGVNGDQSDNSQTWAGAVYVLTRDGSPEVYCTAKTSSAGCVAAIATSVPGTQPTSGASAFSVTAVQVQELRNGLLFAGITGPAALPFSGGTLCVQPPTKRGPVANSGGADPSGCGGSYATLVDDGNVIPAGLDAGPGNSAWYQYWYRDPPNGPGQLGTALSNALRLDFQ